MNFSKLAYLFMVLLVLSAAACEDDEDTMPVCTQQDWVGTYTGTLSCVGETPQDATVTITASGTDQVIVRYNTSNVTTTFDPITVEGCSGLNSASQGGVTGSAEITLDGDNFELREILMGGGFDSDCMLTATRN